MQLKFNLFLFALATLLLAQGCGGAPVPTATPHSDDGTANSAGSLALTHHELVNAHLELQTRSQNDLFEINYLTKLNQKLCERLDALRQSCLPAFRLINDPREKSLSCSSANQIASFSVRLEGGTLAQTTQFALVANNLFETNPFTKGSSTISFYSNHNSGSLVAPRFVDLSQLKLKVLSGTLPKLDGSLKFSFLVSNQVLFNESHLVAADDGQSYLINLVDAMKTIKRSDKCVVSYQELDDLTKAVKRDTAPAAPVVDPKHDVEKNMPESNEQWKTLIDELKTNVANLQDDVEESDLQLDFERDRQGKLTKELLGESALGCFAHQTIRKIQLQIKGVHLEDGAMFETSGEEKTVGQPASIQFQFGEQLTFNNSDEERSSVFREEGALLFEDKGNRKIGEIEFVRVDKGGVDFKNAKTCSQFLLFFKVCRFQNWETKRYRMDDLSVYVNDQLFYKRTGLNAVLEKNSLRWEDKNLGMNPSYLQLMTRTDCPTVQD